MGGAQGDDFIGCWDFSVAWGFREGSCELAGLSCVLYLKAHGT